MTSARWEQIRQCGRKRFVFRYGVLGWGLGSGVIASVALLATTPMKSTGVRIALAIAVLILMPLGGILWGNGVWYFMNHHYTYPPGGGPLQRRKQTPLEIIAIVIACAGALLLWWTLFWGWVILALGTALQAACWIRQRTSR